MGQEDTVDHAVPDRRRGAEVLSCLCGLEWTTTGSTRTRLVSEPGVMSRLCRSVLLGKACLMAFFAFVGFAAAAETSARPMSREFSPFDILAWEILAGIEASNHLVNSDDVQKEAGTRIAVWPFPPGQAPVPASLANEYNDKLLVSLLSQGGSRHRFIAREALSAVIKEIDESSSRDAELDELLAALVEGARADVLVVGKLRHASSETIVLSYEAIRVRDGTILAATSHQRLPLDPDEVKLAARSKAPVQGGKPTSPPRPNKALDAPVMAGVGTAAEPSASSRALAVPNKDVASVQSVLWELGYDPGPLDGILGPQTRAAIREYQRDAHLPVDGYVSGKLIHSLHRDVSVHRGYAAKPQPARPVLPRVDPVAVNPRQPVLYNLGGTHCREYRQNVGIGGAIRSSYGRACLQADGSWKIVR